MAVLPAPAAFEAQFKDLLAGYRRTLETDRRFLLETFEYADLARKVVGVGSVGTRCWIVLLLGRDESDPLFLQVKEADKSVLAAFAGASEYTNQGQRVVAGQRLMQASSDIFLGWQRTEAGLDGKQHDFYVRQLRDRKYSADIETMVPRGMRIYGELCGLSGAQDQCEGAQQIREQPRIPGAGHRSPHGFPNSGHSTWCMRGNAAPSDAPSISWAATPLTASAPGGAACLPGPSFQLTGTLPVMPWS